MSVNSAIQERQQKQAEKLNGLLGSNGLFSRSQLKQLMIIEDGKNVYNFQLTAQNQATDGQILLLMADVFLAVDVKVSLVSKVAAKAGSFRFYTYPNIAEFETANGAVARDLEIFYNGILAIKQEITTTSPTTGTQVFRRVHTEQQNGAAIVDEMEYNDGFQPLDPFAILSGGRNMENTVTIPTTAGLSLAATAVGRENYLALEFQGFLFTGFATKLGDLVNATRGKKLY